MSWVSTASCCSFSGIARRIAMSELSVADVDEVVVEPESGKAYSRLLSTPIEESIHRLNVNVFVIVNLYSREMLAEYNKGAA